MTQITITPDGRLVDGEKSEDLTDVSHQYLFRNVSLSCGEPVTVRSVLLLVQRSPVLRQVYLNWLPDDMLEEALGPLPAYSLEGGISPERIEFLELYRMFYQGSASRRLDGLHTLQFHGVGFVQAEDVLEHGTLMYAAGDRPYYGLCMTSCRQVLDIPIRYCEEATVFEDDKDQPNYCFANDKLFVDELQLGELIQAMLEELAYYGVPEVEDVEKHAEDAA